MKYAFWCELGHTPFPKHIIPFATTVPCTLHWKKVCSSPVEVLCILKAQLILFLLFHSFTLLLRIEEGQGGSPHYTLWCLIYILLGFVLSQMVIGVSAGLGERKVFCRSFLNLIHEVIWLLWLGGGTVPTGCSDWLPGCGSLSLAYHSVDLVLETSREKKSF